jgi:hypothetical protein
MRPPGFQVDPFLETADLIRVVAVV